MTVSTTPNDEKQEPTPPPKGDTPPPQETTSLPPLEQGVVKRSRDDGDVEYR